MRILIAEDDALTRRILQRAIQNLGHECLLARDGTQAWKLHESESYIDVIISDRMMPGIDGIELCRRVREASENWYTFFIFITALGEKGDLIEGLKAGADDYLAKPLDHEQLQARLLAASRVTSLH
ncbi:MAG: response regulator transcription factor, partial [Rubrobacteraceae bacterium]